MTQTIDFRFEAFFLLLVLTSLALLATAIVLKICARRSAAKRLLAALGIGWCVYLSTVFVVAAATPQTIVSPQHDLCFDDMCFAIANVQAVARLGSAPQVSAKGMFYVVTVRVSNHARARTMRENGLRAILWAPHETHRVSPAGQLAWDHAHPGNAPLASFVQPGQSILSDQVFDVPRYAAGSGLVLNSGFTPGFFVIGECPLFHKPTIIRLPQPSAAGVRNFAVRGAMRGSVPQLIDASRRPHIAPAGLRKKVNQSRRRNRRPTVIVVA